MDRVEYEGVADSTNNIKFIGVGYKGIDILNKIANDKKVYIGLATIDTKENYINENIKENIILKDNNYESNSLSKGDFFKITDAINKNKNKLFKLIKKEKIIFITCDICDLASVHILIELGKIAKENDILAIPIIINTQKSNNINYNFFMKKINKCIGPSINISNNKVFGNIKFTNDTIDDYFIIDSIIDLFIDNMKSSCSLSLEYEDIRWLFEGPNDVEMSIIKVNENSSEDDMKNKLIKNRICKGTYKVVEKIMINATANKEYISCDQAFKILQRIALVLEENSGENCKIEFSFKFSDKVNKSLEILTVQA